MKEGPPKEVVGRILDALQDQPFEDAMAVLADLQVFLMLHDDLLRNEILSAYI